VLKLSEGLGVTEASVSVKTIGAGSVQKQLDENCENACLMGGDSEGGKRRFYLAKNAYLDFFEVSSSTLYIVTCIDWNGQGEEAAGQEL
jgi:hypothetical protein